MAAFETITQEPSPYTVPSGRRVTSFSFVGGTGGGNVTITNTAGTASDPIVVAEGEAYERTLPTDDVPYLGGGAIFAWSNIARYAIEQI